MRRIDPESGFTLIELSIVLVIIGLIVGGILVGRDLISAAEVRAQISQIEKFNTATNTFHSKFSAIPGDMALSIANQFGFISGACSGMAGGLRDGNGLIDGSQAPNTLEEAYGETGLFWQDISSSMAGSLIDGSFPNNGAPNNQWCTGAPPTLTLVLGTTYVGDYIPSARIGHGNFVYVYENAGYNWFGLSALAGLSSGQLNSSGNLPVMQTYNIDKKIDDGLPTTGAVQAVAVQWLTIWHPTNASTDSTTTCYNTSSNVYSIGSAANYGNGGNCALSFRFQ